MPLRQTIIVTLLCLMLPVLALGQWSTTSDDLFEIEVLVFQNHLAYLEGEELWTSDTVNTELPGLAEAIDVRNELKGDSAVAKAAITLEADGHYRVLIHKRWLQTAEPRSEAKWIRVSDPNVANQNLEGTLRFYQGRYLHVDLELLYRDTGTGGSSPVELSSASPQIFRISEHRRIRSGEVHYFDHPKFGAMVRVAPVEE